jgi:putative DNA primase/helicase
MYANNIPQELRARPQWVVWKYEDKGDGTTGKVPYSPIFCKRASSTDATTWSTWEAAEAAYVQGKYDGVGYVFTAEDPYLGIDLDDCFNPMESADRFSCIQDPEKGWVYDLGSYTEVSPSGTGLKVIVRGQLPKDLDRHSWKGNGIYSEGRFFTITGDVLSRNYSHITSVASDTLNALLRVWFPPVVSVEYGVADERMTDTEVRTRLTYAKNEDKWSDLERGDWEPWYPSQSDADAGLIALYAFYTGPCPAQLDRLFRSSGLMRDKWDESRGGGGQTYGSRTIDRVLSLQEEYYEMAGRSTVVDSGHPQLGIVERGGQRFYETFDGEDKPPKLVPVELYPIIHAPTVDVNETLHFGTDAFGSNEYRRTQKKKWAKGLEGYAPLTREEMPEYLRLVVDHVAPLATRLGDDWVDLMALSFLSSFFAGKSIERLPLNLWVIGLGAQGVGKSVTSDELELITRETGSFLACNLSTFTGGSNAGLIRLLSQDKNKKVLCYASEWTSLIGLMNTEHSGSLREALLNYYDGRSYTHVLATEILNVESPYLVVNGVTTKANWCKATDFADTGNGFYSRFLFVAPDIQPADGEYPYRTKAQRAQVVDRLWKHIASLPDLELMALETRPSPAYTAYAKYLGMDNHSGFIDMDEVGLSIDDDDAQPAGRRLAQVKKVAAVLALLEEEPIIRQGGFLVPERCVDMAVRLVQRASAYARRAYGWLSRSKDEEQASMVLHSLEKQPDTEYGLVTRTGLGVLAVRAATELLEGEQLIVSRVMEGRRTYMLKEGIHA